MKAFVASLVVLVAVSAGAWLALESLGMSSQNVYSTSSVRH